MSTRASTRGRFRAISRRWAGRTPRRSSSPSRARAGSRSRSSVRSSPRGAVFAGSSSSGSPADRAEMRDPLLRVSNLRMVYEPYPLGIIAPAFEPDLYAQLLRQFPPLDLFEFLPGHGNKYALSEKYHPKQYADFVSRHEVWRELRAYVKSEEFRFSVIDAVRDC